MKDFWKQLSERKKQMIIFFLIIVVGFADYLTGAQISFSLFYLVPIGIASWYSSRKVGYAASILSVAFWLGADLLGHSEYSSQWIPFWNAFVRLAIFVLVSYITSSLQESRQKQEDLLSFLVHDLRAPLGLVLTGFEILQMLDEESSNLTEDQRMVIDSGITSGKRMLILVNSLLDLPRLEKGQMPLNKKDVLVNSLVEEAVEGTHLLADRNGVILQTELLGKEELNVDPDLIVRVLVNLISNAIKFSPFDGLIVISVKKIEQKIEFAISDQGPGIPAEWAKRVFDKFVQVEGQNSGVSVGSGIGLNFCKLAVEAHKGRIWLESEQGKGTTVYFRLPM